jgi:hydroxyacylglutathione hydrolase
MADLKVQPIRCLKDNFNYIIFDNESRKAVLIDATDAASIQSFLIEQDLNLCAILITHHHADHLSGLSELIAMQNTPIWASQITLDRAQLNNLLKIHTIAPNLEIGWLELLGSDEIAHARLNQKPNQDQPIITGISTPGHTQGHFAYYLKSKNEFNLFTGDILFSFGCGRCFDGSPQELFASLQKIKNLPQSTRLHFGHDYGEQNFRFWNWAHENKLDAQYPDLDLPQVFNQDTTRADLNDEDLRGKTNYPSPTPAGTISTITPTLPPSTLAIECQLNPFLRLNSESDFIYWRGLRDRF